MNTAFIYFPSLSLSQGDMLRLYFLMTCEMRRTIPPVIHEATIRGLADVPENCGTEYRFRTRSHLKRVMDCCRFPSMVTLDNGQRAPKDLCFVFFVRRLASVCTVNQLIQLGFGRDPPFWSRVIKAVARHIKNELGCLLEPSNISRFQPRFDMYSEAIRVMVNETHRAWHPGAVNDLFPVADDFSPFAFLDGNCTSTCTPGAGPITPGRHGDRNPDYLAFQEAFYTGWIHKHGIKHITLDAPDGLVLFCWGPSSMRHNDLYMLESSDANGQVYAAQAHLLDALKKVMYGDSIFPWRDCLRARMNASPADPMKTWKDCVDFHVQCHIYIRSVASPKV